MSADYHSMMTKGQDHLTLQAFKKQCQLISLKHPEIQTAVLEACGQPNNSNRVDWPVFIQVMAHLRYRSVSRSQQIAFWMQIFNKYATSEQVITAEKLRLLLTQLTAEYDSEGGYRTTNFIDKLFSRLTELRVIEQEQVGHTNQQQIRCAKMREVLQNDELSVNVFEQLLYQECEFNIDFK